MRRIYIYIYIYITVANCIPKNMPADLKTLIRVSGDFFLLFGKGGGGGFLMADACRAYLDWNGIFFFIYLFI